MANSRALTGTPKTAPKKQTKKAVRKSEIDKQKTTENKASKSKTTARKKTVADNSQSEEQQAAELVEEKVDVNAEVTWTAGKMAKACAVTTRRLSQLAEEGTMKRVAHGRYAVIPSLIQWNKQLREQNARHEEIERSYGDFINDPVQHIDVERAKHEHLKTKLTEIKLELMEGKVHKAEDVERVVTDMLLKMKSKLVAIPSQIAPRIEGKSKNEVESLLNIEIEKALMELSEYNAEDFRSDDYIEISDDEVTAVMENEEKDS